MNYDHFATDTSPKVQKKLGELAELIKEDFISEIEGFDHLAGGDPDLDEISGKSYSGFIPFQKGGFSIADFYSTRHDPITKKEEKFNEEVEKSVFEDFCSDNEIKNAKDWNDLTDEQQEELQEYESGYSEQSYLNAEIWIDDDGKIFTRLSTNYKDVPYSRSKYAEDLREKSYTEKEFLAMENKEIAENLFNNL